MKKRSGRIGRGEKRVPFDVMRRKVSKVESLRRGRMGEESWRILVHRLDPKSREKKKK